MSFSTFTGIDPCPLARGLVAALACALMLGLLLPADSSALILNTEKERRAEGGEGLSRRLNLSAALRSGNVDLVDFGLGLRLEKWDEHSSWLLIAGGRVAEKDNSTFVQEGQVHVRRNFRSDQRLDPEVFVQLQTNEFADLELRALLGGGARMRLESVEGGSAWLGLGAMIESELLDVDSGSGEDSSVSALRLNTYLSLSRAVGESADFSATVFVQPRVDDPGDLRAMAELVLETRVTERISLDFSLSLEHDSRPPGDVEQTDVQLRNTLVFDW